MLLASGSRLGPYEIIAAVGAGGMGEVYRARDPRLRREVAIKVLPAAVSTDSDRLRRFEQEALAAASLNHPNILAVYDVGTDAGNPYVVSELLDGATLRQVIDGGAVPMRKAIDIALQIANGLAAAHGKGIVHRDLKPENVFVTKEGRVKILDFGLAKLTASEVASSGSTHLLAGVPVTEPGMIVGTPGYMAPEQVRGEAVDHRSDIFAFAAVLYEMLSGARAFAAGSPIETMNAILKDDPPELALTNRSVPPALQRLIRRCLEKSPEQRFQSMKDVVFSLEAFSSDSTTNVTVPALSATTRPQLVALLLALLVLAAAVGGFVWGRSAHSKPPLAFKRLTFRRGTVLSAKFAPDGQTIVYEAAWQGDPPELFSTRIDSPEARPLGLTRAKILSISSTGEMAVRLRNGTLARAPLAGGAPREVAENVVTAGWAPDGKTLAIVRTVFNRRRLEYPPGKMLYEAAGFIDHVTIAANGDLVACSESTTGIGSLASIVVVDRGGKKRTLSDGWRSVNGVAWSRDGKEIWFTASKTQFGGRLLAVTLDGRLRELAPAPANLALHDISRDGPVLVARADVRVEARGLAPGETTERDLSWSDYTGLSDLSPDGRTLIITEDGEAGLHTFLRRTDGSPAVQLGDGGAFGLSPDGRWIISQPLDPPRLQIVPTGPGEARPIHQQGFDSYLWANWFPDGKQILFVGSEVGHGLRPYVQDVDGDAPHAIAPEGVTMMTGSTSVSPDGAVFAGIGPDQRVALYPTGGGQPRALPTLAPGDLPSRWSGDGRFLYVFRRSPLPAPISRLDVVRGTKEAWKEVGPTDLAGVTSVGHVQITPDGRSYVYNYVRMLSDLYLVQGLH